MPSFQRVACMGEVMIELIAGTDACATLNVAGDTYNSAVYLARVGDGLSVDYVTVLGQDSFSDRILAHMDRIAHIPGVIVQGRYDMICPPASAYSLSEAWPASELRMVRNAGHALSEPGISAELVRAMDMIGEALA